MRPDYKHAVDVETHPNEIAECGKYNFEVNVVPKDEPHTEHGLKNECELNNWGSSINDVTLLLGKVVKDFVTNALKS